jgi:hypothetical protein
MTATHIWVTRAVCPVCGDYFWTNPGSSRISCLCAKSAIYDEALRGEALEVTDVAGFEAQVTRDQGDVTILHGAA